MSTEVIARRKTSDGKHVLLWSDGSLTRSLGFAIKGAWFNPRPDQRARALAAGWLTLGEVEVVDEADLSRLARAARTVADRGGLPGDVRELFAASAPKPSWAKPEWTVLSADRNGKPTDRAWRLHRMSPWSGHVVFNRAGKFTLSRRVAGAGDTFSSTGVEFRRLTDMVRWLCDNRPFV